MFVCVEGYYNDPKNAGYYMDNSFEMKAEPKSSEVEQKESAIED